MTKAKNILTLLITAGIFISGILPAMSQEVTTEEKTDNTFKTDILDLSSVRNFIDDNAEDLTLPSTAKNDIVSIRFTWNNPVNMATFTRNGKIWVVFDHQNKFDIETMKAEAGDLVKEIYTLYHPAGAIVVIEPNKDVKHSLRKEGLLWILDLYTGKPPLFKINNYTIFTQFDSLKNSYLFIPTPFAGNVMSFIDPEVGDMFITEVVRILPKVGAFCELAPGKDGLIHISEISSKFVKNPKDVVNIGDEIEVEIIGVDEEHFHLNLSLIKN